MILPNIDWITVAFDFSNFAETSKDIVELLKAAKENAKQKQNEKTNEQELITIDGITFEVYPNGNKTHAYILDNEDYKINIAEFRSKKDTIYPVIAIIHSKSLWAYSPIVTYKRLLCLVNNVFGEIKKNMVSRIDLCCHTDIIDFSKVSMDAFRNRANKKNIYWNHGEISGFNFGTSSGGLMCRIYNKTLEIIEKNDKTWFFEIWINKGFDATVWNIEFELHREFFRNYSIDTVEQAFEHIGSMWDYCTNQWIVLTDKDRTRLENCTTDSNWLKIADAFKDFTHEPLIKRQKQNLMDGEALIPAWTGYTTTIAAFWGESDIEAALDKMKGKGEKHLLNKNKTYADEIMEKSITLYE